MMTIVCVVFYLAKTRGRGSGVGEAKSNFRGEGKHELRTKEGEMLTIMCEDGCPSAKCLVKNNEGHCELIKCALF